MRPNSKLLAALFLGIIAPASAQTIVNPSSSGSGAVSSVTGANGIVANPTTGAVVLNTTITRNDQTGTTYAVLATDGGKLDTASNASAIAWSLSAASTTGFTAGFAPDFYTRSTSTGVLTVTPTTSTIAGLTSLIVQKGQLCETPSDSTNYDAYCTVPLLAADTMLGGGATSSFGVPLTMPSCTNDGSHASIYTPSTHVWNCASISGGGGSPGGSTTQVQYNNAGSFGGITNATTDGTTLTMVSPVITTGVSMLGTTYTGVTGTANLVGSASPTFTGTITAATLNATALQGSSTITASGNRLIMSGNVSATAWTTAGKGFVQNVGTFTDTSSSGTIATEYINVSNTATFAFSNATTVTNAFATYLKDPAAGTNATLTNKWALGTDSLYVNGANLNLPGLGASSAATTGTLCWTTATGLVNVDTTTTCLLSLEEFKDIKPGGIKTASSMVEKLAPFAFTYKRSTPEYRGGDTYEHFGLGAHATEKVSRDLIGYTPSGKIRGVRYADSVTALLVASQQEMLRRLSAQDQEIAKLKTIISKRH